jgi:rhamnosyltransferase
MAKIDHRLGNISTHSLGSRIIQVSNYPPVRSYYITRNYLYLFKNYFFLFPIECSFFFRQLIGHLTGIILFEKQKKKKITMIVQGIFHFLINRFGPL